LFGFIDRRISSAIHNKVAALHSLLHRRMIHDITFSSIERAYGGSLLAR
jgi:hypothetical protein